MRFSREFFSKRFDSSIIEPTASDEAVINFIRRCKEFSHYFAALAFNLHQIPLAAQQLRGSDIRVCAVIAYPLGCLPYELKVLQAKYAVEKGAHQLDICINVGLLKSGKYDSVRREIESVVKAVREADTDISIIPNIAYLTKEEKIVACKIIKESGATIFKTNTGFGLITTVEDIKLVKRELGNHLQIMVGGGVRSIEDATAMFEAGADKIATSTPFQIFYGIERYIKYFGEI
jgi:deoxyribose-phosphate aldolase